VLSPHVYYIWSKRLQARSKFPSRFRSLVEGDLSLNWSKSGTWENETISLRPISRELNPDLIFGNSEFFQEKRLCMWTLRCLFVTFETCMWFSRSILLRSICSQLLTCLSLYNTQARAVNLIPALRWPQQSHLHPGFESEHSLTKRV